MYSKKIVMFARFLFVLPSAPVFSLRVDNKTEPVSWRNVKATTLFIGAGRSGGSLFGALLDANRQAMISNEYDLINHVLEGKYSCSADGIWGPLYNLSVRQAQHGRAGGGGYEYEVEGQWQGKAERNLPKIMGDRKAGHTAVVPLEDLLSALKTIANCTGKRIMIVYVARNPFDVVGTRYVREEQARKCRMEGKVDFHHCGGDNTFTKAFDAGDAKPIVPRRKTLIKKIDGELHKMRTVQDLIEVLDAAPNHLGVPVEVIEVKYPDLIADPRQTLQRMCDRLALPCDADYLEACAKIINPTNHYTRLYLEWDQDSVCYMKDMAMKNPLLAHWMTDPDPAGSYDAAPRCGDACFPGSWPCPCAATNSTRLDVCHRQG